MVLVFFCYVVYIFGSCTTLHVKSECESAFLPYLSGMQIACVVLYRHLWPVWLYHIYPNYIKKGTILERKNCWIQNVFFDFLYKFSLKKFSFSEEFRKILSWMYSCLHVQYPFQTFIKLEFSQQIFEKHTNIKFRENPFVTSPVVPCRQTDRHEKANSRSSKLYESV